MPVVSFSASYLGLGAGAVVEIDRRQTLSPASSVVPKGFLRWQRCAIFVVAVYFKAIHFFGVQNLLV